MAHKKAGGASAQQKGNVAGKRLGIKVSGSAAKLFFRAITLVWEKTLPFILW